MVGPTRFELVTFCTPSKRATRLRYGPPYVVMSQVIMNFGSGSWISTNDLQVMSLTSYQAAPSRNLDLPKWRG